MSEAMDRALISAESTLGALRTMPPAEAAPFTLQFGRDIGIIGRQLQLHPELAPKVRAFVERTAPLVRTEVTLSTWIGRVYEAADLHSSETEVYGGTLSMRSDLEFFRDLYRDSVASDRVAGIETEEMDESLRAWGTEMYLYEIPDGIPASHVWWDQSLAGPLKRTPPGGG